MTYVKIFEDRFELFKKYLHENICKNLGKGNFEIKYILVFQKQMKYYGKVFQC